MILLRSSRAMWWVSLSDNLERQVRILCLSSIIAKWEESEEDLDEEEDGGGGVWFVVVGFDDFGACDWEPIIIFTQYICIYINKINGGCVRKRL